MGSRGGILKGMARWVLLAVPAAVSFAFACSTGQPPVVGDTDGSKPPGADGGSGGPCAPPVEGCPCTTPGEQSYCGLVYRKSGNRIDCSKGYRTCQEDAGWGACIGDQIYVGD